MAERLASMTERTLLVERDGQAIGTVRLTRDLDSGGIYGFAIDPDWQGRQATCCGESAAYCWTRARQVGLEVAVDNDRALGLYTSMGFTEVTTEDYYALPTAEPHGPSRPV